MSETTAEGIVNPPIDQLLEHVDSKYRLVLFAAKRARQINAYYSQLAEGLLENVGPLVETNNNEKPLSIAMREIQAGVIETHELNAEEIAAEAAAAQQAPAVELDDPFSDLTPPA
ncbi:DNA-directed RNA polymerase subunit omega [Acidipropionibacterium virtanenii]|uniref:DNA-directed RNA polymerase subunit omega n=1 Tax=Acidipropionibacterium virtanenii TaxID=2057246 RepID=A0A344UU58_9ACTN|nr:DNA-directed RNA polymerase subunit omega [Acidipropionibacterium virtanenii]AXE38806.1 DNA-directed RNA polymerase subunit omega [Acidipropionibacterium virtanenii]